MRYELDANGYILAVYFGCYSGTGQCTEYTGTVPYGYTDLINWSENALINAYYIENGNLVLDTTRLKELEAKIEQETIDNEPLLRKDLYGTSDVLDGQYQSATAKGNVLALTNVKKINPKVRITNIDCYKFSKVDVVTQGKNMLKNDAITEIIEGVTFTRLINGGIKINGTATADIEYNLSGSGNNTTSLFALKKNTNYYLNIGSLDCELKYYDGTTSQVYTGESGVINLSESKEVTQVLIKIPSGTTLNETIYPMLECGSSASGYEEYKHRILTIDFNDLVSEGLFPRDDLFPSDDLFPKGTVVRYIIIEDNGVYINVNGTQYYLMKANVNLYDGYNTIYTMQDTYLEMVYNINLLEVDSLEFLQGKSTTTHKFRILEDGSIEAYGGYFEGNVRLTDDGTTQESRLTIVTEGKETNKAYYQSNGIFYYDEFCSGAENLPSITIGHGVAEIPQVNLNNWNDKKTATLSNRYLRVIDNSGSSQVITTINASGITTPVVSQTSLEETKKNFELLESGLDIINQTDIYKYHLKFQEDNEKKHIGVVIGENYKTPKEILSNSEDAVDLYSMIAVAWKSIQEQQLQIEELKNKIKEMESDNNEKN